MTPARIAIGLICALAVAAGRRAYAVSAAVVLSLALMACAGQPPAKHEATEPVEQVAPVSALRMYEQGRADALDDLRALSIWREPARVCVDKVSWVSPDWELPDWGSRKENMELIKECRDGSLHNAILLKRQRQAVESAR